MGPEWIARVLRAQNQVLERVATGSPLGEVLTLLATACESLTPDVLCSVLLVTDGRLHHGAAPSLSPAYCQAIDGMDVGPARGSCGTAAFTGERVIVEDVQTHPYWEGYRDVAAAAQLRACWSEPIRSSRGEVIGTFAMYYRAPRSPGPEDLELIQSFSHLAGVAIERARIEAELERALSSAVADVKVLRGMLPICAWCRRVRDDQGLWAQIEAYVAKHSEATFSHGICPSCTTQMRSS